jgi:hypothetical protein
MRRIFYLCLFLSILLLSSFEAKEAAAEKGASIDFFTKAEAKKAIVNDFKEPYFERLQKNEMNAKTGKVLEGKDLKALQKAARAHYQASVLEFSEDEKKNIRWVVDSIHADLKKHYPLLPRQKWKFLKVNDSVEGGLPHTRHDFIVFSQRITKVIFANKKQNEYFCLLGAANLFIHEQMHVVQRMNPGLFDPLYEDLWGFKKAKEIKPADKKLASWLEGHHLLNPDGTDVMWVTSIKNDKETTWLWPLVTLKEAKLSPKMPQDFQMIGITIVPGKKEDTFIVNGKKGQPVFSDLSKIPAYMKKFNGHHGNHYHPNELGADIFANLFLADHLLDPAKIQKSYIDQSKKMYAPVREYYKKLLK